MSQNRNTGAAASEFGHRGAALIAEKLGARRVSSHSNEFEWNAERVTIRMAHQGNNQVGVLYSMLPCIKAVIAAFETAPDEYELFSLSPDVYREKMRDSNTGQGRVGLVQKKVFMERGRFVAKVDLAPPTASAKGSSACS